MPFRYCIGKTAIEVLRSVYWMIVLLLVCCAGRSFARAAQLESQIPTEDARNRTIITTDTPLPLPQFATLNEWEQRKAFLRNQILVAAGLSPMPKKTPLHPEIFGKLEGDGYTIEKVLIETLPGFYVGGNLYRPRNGHGRHPGILNPHGHWPYGRLENEPAYSGPSLGISLARQGYVVFAYDMVGYTDTIEVPHQFGNPEQRLWSFGPLGLQLWDSIRALDFLETLDDVDPSQLGAVGASGGGTQTFLLTAVDDRVQFASPVNMVSAIMQGGDLCENAPGLRINTSNVEIAAMFAPKPMLLVSATGDWTRNVPKQEFPAIRRIYDLYGKGNEVEVVQIEAEHNFNRLSREAVYRFLAKHHPGLSEKETLQESNISVPMVQQLTVLSDRVLPPDAVDLDGLFHLWKGLAQSQNEQSHNLTFQRERLRQTLAIEIPRNVIAEVHGRSIVLGRASSHDRIPGIWIEGKGKPAIVVDPDGSAAALQTEIVKRLESDGRPILIPDVFQTGAAKAARAGDYSVEPAPRLAPDADDEEAADAAADYPKFLTFNVSVDAARVQDIVTAIAYTSRNNEGVEVFARGDAAVWATFAVAVSDRQVFLDGKDRPRLVSDADYLLHFNVAGILRAGGLGVADRLIHSKNELQGQEQ